MLAHFEWNEAKNDYNLGKHGVSFLQATEVFRDENHFITDDQKHSTDEEKRYFCFGLVGGKVMTVRFTLRENRIRIYGAAFWSNGKKVYAKRQPL
jgi:uncharacterized protein